MAIAAVDGDVLSPEKTGDIGGVGRLKFDVASLGKTVIVSFLVTFIALALMAFMGGGSYVTKKDFVANMENVAQTLQEAKDGYAKSQSTLASTIAGIPSQVSSQVTSATSGLDNQMLSLSGQVANINNSSQANANRLSELAARLDSNISKLLTDNTKLTTDAVALQKEVEALKNSLKALTGVGGDINSLETRIAQLENAVANLGVASVTVDSTLLPQLWVASGSSFFTSSVGCPLVVTNNGASSVSVPVKLVLTNVGASSVIVSSASMSGTSTVSPSVFPATIASGSTLTFSTIATVPANSQIKFTGISVTISYSGATPNVWSAVWSKQ